MAAMENRSVTELSGFRERQASGGRAESASGWRPQAGLVEAPPTGTVTFLLTDVEGSTPLWESDREAMTTAVARHYEILDAAVTARGGVRPVEQGEGDSMVAAFARASDAVAAALDAQRALLAEEWPGGAELDVRMALHTGEAQLREDLYYVGPSIIRAARLRSLASGRQVLVSTATADLLAGRLPADAGLLSLGVHRLKGLREPETVFQLLHPALPAEFPALPSVDALPTNLPTRLTSFVGRQAELLDIAELMGRQRLVTLLGPGGCGKTRLAIQAAGDAFYGYPDGVWWVELATVADPDLVPRAVLGALGVDAKGMDPLQRIAGYLQSRRVLLVLDNCEHVVAAAAAVLEAVLLACPHVTALATSREPLAIAGEAGWRVDPLSLPGEGDHCPDAILASEAVRLFLERAGQVRPGFALDRGNAAAVAGICTRLDGIPLAIELAAARVGALAPERLLAGLAERFRILTGGSRTAQPRQQTLAASVEWSHDLLSGPERVLLRRLAVFVGSFDIDAVEAVASGGCGAGPTLERRDVLTLLPDLVDKSLVGFDGQRYRLLQTIVDFALGKLDAAGETAATRAAHLAHYTAWASAAAVELETGSQVDALARLEAARENLVAALDWALASKDDEAALRLCGDMTLFWLLHGRHAESLVNVRRVLARTSADPTAMRARALWAAGQLGFFAMDLPGGYGTVESAQAVEMATASGNDEILGRSLGTVHLVQSFGAPAVALEGLAQARAAASRAGDRYGMAAATTYTALALTFGLDRRDLAEPHLRTLAAEATETPYWACWHGMISGVGAWRAGRLAEAVGVLTAADELAWVLGEPVIESWCAIWSGDVHIDQGDLAAAERVIARSATWMDRSSFGRVEAVQSRRVRMLMARGELAGATALLASVGPTLRSMGFPFVTAEMDLIDGRLAVEAGNLATARTSLAGAAAVAETLTTPWYLTACANLAGRIARAAGELGAAEDAHHRALARCVDHGFDVVAAQTLECLAGLAAAGRSWAESVRLYGAAAALAGRTGHVRAPLDTPPAEADLAAAEPHLGEDGFAAAYAEGSALTCDEAAAYASRARGERKRPARGWASLTPAELSVAELATQGLTNAEIGARLFIAPGTAKIHLSHIYAKLGVTNRAQLAVQATVRGLGT